MYQDRKMLKYLAFDALSSSASDIAEMKYKKFSRAKKALSQDKIIEINELLLEAYSNKLNISLTYFHQGYPKTTEGVIKRIDTNTKLIIFESGMSISFYVVEDVKISY